jgi:PAS domain S-box-containing protein
MNFGKTKKAMKKVNKSGSALLRQKAEELLKNKPSKYDSQLSEVENRKLIYELQVHQIELEIQNEELLQAQNVAETANDKYFRLYDLAPSGYFTLSREGEIVELNLAGALLLDKDLPHLRNSRFASFVAPETRAIFILFLEKIFKTNRKESCDVTLITSGIQPVYVNLSGISTKSGKQCFVTAVDITKRKLTEKQLSEREVQYRNLADSGSALTWTSGTDKLCNYFNGPWLKFTGRTLEQEIGNGWTEGAHPDDFDKCLEIYLTAFDKREPFEMEYRLRHSSGEYRWIVTMGTPNFDSTGEFIGYIGHCFDISERKLFEDTQSFLLGCGLPGTGEDFFESLANYLAETLKMEYVCIDRLEGDGLTAQTVAIYNNGLFESNVRYALKDTPCGEVVDKRVCCYRKGVRHLFPNDLALQDLNAESYVGTTLIDSKGQAIGLIAIIGHQPLHSEGKAESMLKMVAPRAAGELERRGAENVLKETLEQLLEAKERAEESDHLKSAFLANMSHEIRTPMNGILGFAALLKEPNLTGDEQQKYIRIIEKSGKRMLNIINDIIDISKIESGLMKLGIAESDINEQIEYIYTFFKPEVEAKGIHLFFKNSLSAKEAIIEIDSEKIYAILTNLVKNAIKYTHQGSIEFGYEKRGEYLEFFVKDTGIGIAKNRQEAIFERFIQADIFDIQAYQGAGLGLSIAKAYVEMLGGKIWVKSDEGIGSIFYFTIPYNTKKQEQGTTANVSQEDESGQIKNLKILIAEDDETSDLLITSMLNKISNEVLHAKTGIETVEICRNNPDLDLILMDIRMPGMNGYDATRQIRKYNKEIIIIAQTAYALSGDRQKAIAAGCNEYLSKPIDKDELVRLIQKYFNQA